MTLELADLTIKSNTLVIADTDGDNMLVGLENGEARLYNNGSQKLATTSTGIDVTGTVTADGLRVDTSSTGGFKVEDNGASAGVKITGFQGTTNANVRNLEFHAQDFIVHTGGPTGTTTTKRMKVDNTTGDISFYEDTGHQPKFFWDASAEELGLRCN
jgi:hypothetical protein